MMNSRYIQQRLEVERQIVDFERGINNLTAVIGGQPDNVMKAFRQWVRITPFPWQVGLDYCIERAIYGKSLPFVIDV